MWDHKLGLVSNFKPRFSLKNQERCKPIKKWLHIILRKWGFFYSKDSK